jgi:hypothetical protein
MFCGSIPLCGYIGLVDGQYNPSYEYVNKSVKGLSFQMTTINGEYQFSFSKLERKFY